MSLQEEEEEEEGGLLMDLGWTATRLVDGCCRCGSMPSPYVFIYCKQMTGPSRVRIASTLPAPHHQSCSPPGHCLPACLPHPPPLLLLLRALTAMAKPSMLLTLSVWLLAGSLLRTEATYYRHHRYVPHYRYREHSANTENLLPEVSNPVPQPDAPTYPVIPEVFHPAPEVIHPVPDAPDSYHPPEVYHPAPEASSPAGNNRVFYGIMFDAGSTGSRIHIYKFIQKDPGELQHPLSLTLSLSVCVCVRACC